MFFNKKKEVDIQKLIKDETKKIPTKEEMKRWLKSVKEKKCTCAGLSSKIKEIERALYYYKSEIERINKLQPKLDHITSMLDVDHLEQFKMSVNELTRLINMVYGRL